MALQYFTTLVVSGRGPSDEVVQCLSKSQNVKETQNILTGCAFASLQSGVA